jgi:uncharacterized protein (TIGR00251 family)
MLKQIKRGVTMEVRVKTGSNRFALVRSGGRLVLEVTSPPREGMANLEIVKGLRRMLGRHVEIVRGMKSKDKVLLVVGATPEEVEKAIQC